MSRRSTPERIDDARREATHRRLVSLGVTDATADAWIDAWARQANHDGIEPGRGYWDACWRWIEDQRRLRVRP